MQGLPWFHRTIISPVTQQDHECVCHVQKALDLPVTGEMDAATRQGVLSVQHIFGLRISGAIDIDTARQIERLRRWESL